MFFAWCYRKVIGAHGAAMLGGGDIIIGTIKDTRKQKFHKLMQQMKRESPKIELNN
jgi:hypothetical protein